ncbi:tetratricopeptide repeat protein [Candidatus Neomarinimicrobiota bacterium]
MDYVRGHIQTNVHIAAFILAGMSVLWGADQDIVDRYETGMNAYYESQWPLAIQEFEAIIQRGFEASELYYNLGNAYYRSGQYAGAIWAYEKSLQMTPNNEDVRHNLALANMYISDQVRNPEVPQVLGFYRQLRESFTTVEWFRWVSLALILFALTSTLQRFTKWQFLGWLGTPALLIALITGSIAADSYNIDRTIKGGIIFTPRSTVFSAPYPQSTMLFEVHEGLKVSIVEYGNEWYHIELADGKSGWIPGQDLRPL